MKRPLILGFLAFALFFALVLGIAFRLRARAEAEAERDLAYRAQLIANALDRALQSRSAQTLTLAALPSLRGFTASAEVERTARLAIARTELQAIVASDPLVRAARIVDQDGTVMLATDDSINTSLAERAFVREGLRGHLYASVPAREFGEMSQYYAAPIIDNFGNVAGVLVLRIAVQELWGEIRGIGDVLLLDDNGVRIADTTAVPQVLSSVSVLSNDAISRVLSEKQYGAETTQIRVAPFPELAAQLKLRRALQTTARDPNGTPYVIAIRPLETNPWTVVVMAREDLAFLLVNTGYLEAVGWGAASALILAAFAYFALK